MSSHKDQTAGSLTPLTYVHLYTDENGITHFREESFDFSQTRAHGPAVRPLSAGAGVLLLQLKAGAVEDWHNAPEPWYLIVVQGMSEVTASDGEVRRFGPGAVVLIDDVTGRGHQTRTVGDIDHIAAVIPAAKAAVKSAK